MLPALSFFFAIFQHQQIIQLIANDYYVKHSSISQLWTTISRRPIEGRVVTALGKHWCVEHFVCAKVNIPASTLFEWRLFSRTDDRQTLFAVREAFHGKPPLRAERPCLLWDPLPPGAFYIPISISVLKTECIYTRHIIEGSNTIYFTPAVWEPVLCVQPSHPDRRLHRTQQGEQLE